jgi:hypothetical protein
MFFASLCIPLAADILDAVVTPTTCGLFLNTPHHHRRSISRDLGGAHLSQQVSCYSRVHNRTSTS